jgi:glutathione peroxidase
MKTIYDFKVNQIDGKEIKLSDFKNKKILIVNVASQCGLTPQYKQLQELYEKYKQNNFTIIAFPANNFGEQEPGSNKEIAIFCTKNYGVSFPVMEKISVKGKDMHPIYKWLTQKTENGKFDSEVKWNFQKYLINEAGELINVIAPTESPLSNDIINWIESE